MKLYHVYEESSKIIIPYVIGKSGKDITLKTFKSTDNGRSWSIETLYYVTKEKIYSDWKKYYTRIQTGESYTALIKKVFEDKI